VVVCGVRLLLQKRHFVPGRVWDSQEEQTCHDPVQVAEPVEGNASFILVILLVVIQEFARVAGYTGVGKIFSKGGDGEISFYSLEN